MGQTIALLTLVVRDYDEAIDFYVTKLGFTLMDDALMPAQNKPHRSQNGHAERDNLITRKRA